MGQRSCGAKTVAGTPCRWPADECRFHGRSRRPEESAPPEQPVEQGPPPPVAERDLRGTGWWLLEQLTGTVPFAAREGSVAASVLRVLAALGPEPASEDEALAEVELRGRLMHGQPPGTPQEWERAALVFEGDALAEFRRWEKLLEGDGLDRDDPLLGGDLGAGEGEVALLIEDEDGI